MEKKKTTQSIKIQKIKSSSGFRDGVGECGDCFWWTKLER